MYKRFSCRFLQIRDNSLIIESSLLPLHRAVAFIVVVPVFLCREITRRIGKTDVWPRRYSCFANVVSKARIKRATGALPVHYTKPYRNDGASPHFGLCLWELIHLTNFGFFFPVRLMFVCLFVCIVFAKLNIAVISVIKVHWTFPHLVHQVKSGVFLVELKRPSQPLLVFCLHLWTWGIVGISQTIVRSWATLIPEWL